jgi:uncharacterized DUF497 family protein
MDFEWDNNKNQLNCEKHGLLFEDAELIFSGKTVTFKDDRKNYGESRFITLGELKKRVIVLVHTERNGVIRIISMRKANEREKKIYLKRLKEIG